MCYVTSLFNMQWHEGQTVLLFIAVQVGVIFLYFLQGSLEFLALLYGLVNLLQQQIQLHPVVNNSNPSFPEPNNRNQVVNQTVEEIGDRFIALLLLPFHLSLPSIPEGQLDLILPIKRKAKHFIRTGLCVYSILYVQCINEYSQGLL